jgi:hypothetical protein
MTWRRRGATIGLSAASILLCVVIYAETAKGPRDAVPYPAAARIALGTREHPADAVGATDRRAEWLNQIMARPLFSPTRRPVETTVSGLPRLTGIVVAGSERVAIFAAPANEHPIVAHSGTRVGAYEVQTIADDGVTVLGPGGITLIRPIFDVARPAGPAQSGTPVARAQPARPATR